MKINRNTSHQIKYIPADFDKYTSDNEIRIGDLFEINLLGNKTQKRIYVLTLLSNEKEEDGQYRIGLVNISEGLLRISHFTTCSDINNITLGEFQRTLVAIEKSEGYLMFNKLYNGKVELTVGGDQ
jgi:hypothetical protein